MDPVIQGQPFAVNLVLKVFKTVGAGQIIWRLRSVENTTQILTADMLVPQFDLEDNRVYSLQVQKHANMALGKWNADVIVCEGDCDWVQLNGPHTKLLAKETTSFHVVPPSPVST